MDKISRMLFVVGHKFANKYYVSKLIFIKYINIWRGVYLDVYTIF